MQLEGKERTVGGKEMKQKGNRQDRANQKQESRKRKRREGRSTKTCKVMKKARRQGETDTGEKGQGEREQTQCNSCSRADMQRRSLINTLPFSLYTGSHF